MDVIDSFTGDYSFLSNFFIFPFEYKGFLYKSVEHFYQASKTILYLDRIEILSAETPAKAKKLGRHIQLRPNWEEIKVIFMIDGLRLKFSIKELKTLLLETEDAKLIEGNYWHDNYWGDCYCRKCSNIIGKNKLGLLLMQIRKESSL